MIDEDMTCTIPDPLYRRLEPAKREELAEKIRQLYFKREHVTENSSGSLVDVTVHPFSISPPRSRNHLF